MIKADEQLDLCGMIAPYCLLMCKATLASMQPGAVIEISVCDPETVRDLLTVLDRSGEKVVARLQSEDATHLWVQKGLADQSPCLIRFQGVDNG
jgi:TusA-related sulfurtransferase